MTNEKQMVKVKKDLTGMIFGRLTVLEQAYDHILPDGRRRAQWLCKCSCEPNKQIIVYGQNLTKRNGTKSCGCLRKEQASVNGSMAKKDNIYELNLNDEYGAYGVGYCSNTNSKFYFDMDDYDKIKGYTWCEHISTKGYHSLETHDLDNDRKIIRMHWLITGKYYDHADRNPLNNRKNNLRIANNSENGQNSSIPTNNKSGIIGVSWHKVLCKWQAYIKLNYKNIYLGLFENKNDAIKARLQGEIKFFQNGFEPQRHLFEEYGIVSGGTGNDSSV